MTGICRRHQKILRRSRLSHISFNRLFSPLHAPSNHDECKVATEIATFSCFFLCSISSPKKTEKKYRVSIVFGTFFMIFRNFFYIFFYHLRKKLILCTTELESVMRFHIVKNTHRKVKTLYVSLKRLSVEKPNITPSVDFLMPFFCSFVEQPS